MNDKLEYEKIVKAFGSCTLCYGKGYHTTLDYTTGGADFYGDKSYRSKNKVMRYCTCDRGVQLGKLVDEYAISELERLLKPLEGSVMTTNGNTVPKRHYYGLIKSIQEAITRLKGDV